MIHPADFREILHYVPGFRQRVFVIALDGEIIADANFRNLLLDVALLRSLNIHVVLVHGIGYQLRELAEKQGREISNADGTGVTDEVTMQFALAAANGVTHQVLAGLASVDLQAAAGNAVVAHPAGILGGVDMRFTGRVDRIETATLTGLLERDILPVLAPLGIDGQGQTYRVNSDELAVEAAVALTAIKGIFATVADGVQLSGELLRQISVDEAERILRDRAGELDPAMVSKLRSACDACRRGVDRMHVVNGRADEGLLAEVFSSQGVGTLIYHDEYQVIRQAKPEDAAVVFQLVQQAADKDEVLPATREAIAGRIGDFFLYEVDRHPIACVALREYPEHDKAELASLVVGASHENRGLAKKLVSFVEAEARRRGFAELFCLSTQAFNYFKQQAGFTDAEPDDLPPERREQWSHSGRNSRILKKLL